MKHEQRKCEPIFISDSSRQVVDKQFKLTRDWLVNNRQKYSTNHVYVLTFDPTIRTHPYFKKLAFVEEIAVLDALFIDGILHFYQGLEKQNIMPALSKHERNTIVSHCAIDALWHLHMGRLHWCNPLRKPIDRIKPARAFTMNHFSTFYEYYGKWSDKRFLQLFFSPLYELGLLSYNPAVKECISLGELGIWFFERVMRASADSLGIDNMY